MRLDLTDKAASVSSLLQKMEKYVSLSGKSEAEFANAVGSSNALFKNLRKGSMPSVERLNAILAEIGETLVLGNPDGPSELDAVDTTLIDGRKFATVARHEAQAAAGGGYVNLDLPPIDHLAFSKTWLLQNGIQPSACVLINARGQSMEPSIYDGDLVMIDRRKRDIRSGRIYVYNHPGDGTRIKRLELVPNAAIIIRSDNPNQKEFAPEYITAESMNDISQNIVGEVIWSGHKWG